LKKPLDKIKILCYNKNVKGISNIVESRNRNFDSVEWNDTETTAYHWGESQSERIKVRASKWK